MKLYGAIDLHSTNNVTVLIDEEDKIVYQKRLPNDLVLILKDLSVYQPRVEGIVVESTYNWYWLVDGLMEQGYKVHLANTAAIQQYEGLKYTDDHSDARWLAHLLRLGVLRQGYIYPRAERPVRDLLRKRSQLVRHRTTHVLSIQNLLTRNTGSSMKANQIKGLDVQQVDRLLPDGDLALAVKANVAVMLSADEQVELLEQTILQRVQLRSQFRFLKTVPGTCLPTGRSVRFWRSPSCWRPETSGDLPLWETSLRTVGVWAVRRSATARRKARATPRTGISIWPGRSSKRPTLRSGLVLRSTGSISERRPRPRVWWRSKRWRTSCVGLVTIL